MDLLGPQLPFRVHGTVNDYVKNAQDVRVELNERLQQDYTNRLRSIGPMWEIKLVASIGQILLFIILTCCSSIFRDMVRKSEDTR